MGCILFARGRDFDVDEFLATSDLASAEAFRRGEPKSHVRPADVREHSGFIVPILKSHSDSFDEQIEAAVAYLRTSRDALAQLDEREDVDEKGLSFGVRWKATYTHTDEFPSELVRLAGRFGFGLAIAHYPMDERHPRAKT